MLKGRAIYKGHTIELTAVDMTDSMQFKMQVNTFDAVDMFDCIENSAGSFVRNYKINTTTCKSEIPNKEFNCVFAATIRYAKSNCLNIYRDMMFSDVGDDYNPEKVSIFEIPNIGTVKLKLGYVCYMNIKTRNIEIFLEESDDDTQEAIFGDFNAKSYTVKISADVLGFQPTEVIKQSALSDNGLYATLEEIMANNPTKDYSWLLDMNFIIVDDDNVDEIINMIKNHDGKVAFDTETTGLKINFKSRVGQADVLVGIIFAINSETAYYFPLRHKRIHNLCGGDHEYFMEHYAREILETKHIICHNGAYDWKVAYIYNINTNIKDDTLIAFKCTYGYMDKNFKVALKSLISSIFHRDSLELENMVDSSWGSSDVKFWDLPYELVRLYACADGTNTFQLMEYIDSIDLLGSFNAKKIYEIEVLFSRCCAYQEFYGHRVDVDNIPTLQAENDKILTETYIAMKRIAGHEFNPASSQQMISLFYDELGMPEQTKVEKGVKKRTVDKTARAALMEYENDNGEPLYPIVHLYHEWCDASTIQKNFLKGLKTLATEDGYMFTEVGQMATTTGRVSVSKPNYQGYNKPVKKRILPRPGFYVTDNDYSSIEYRVLASLSGQEQLIEAFKDPDLNYHTYQAARIFGIPYEAVTDTLRKQAKGINFGLPYGMGDRSLGGRVFGAKTDENTRKAANLRKLYFEGQEKVEEFFKRVRAEGVANGYTSTYYGRRRYYDKSKVDIESIKRQAGNAVIQGTAADLYKIGVCRLFIEVCNRGWLGKALFDAFVHDAITCEVSNDIDPVLWLSVVKKSFELNIEGWCNLYIGFGYGKDWYDAHTIELPVQLQDELVDKYAENGCPYWDKNIYHWLDWIQQQIHDYEERTIVNFLTAEENQGKVIKASVNAFLSSHANEFIKEYLKVKQKYIVKNSLDVIVDGKELKEYLHGKHIYMSDVAIEDLPKYKAEYLAEIPLDTLKEKLEANNIDVSVLDELKDFVKENNCVYLEEHRKTKVIYETMDVFCKCMGIPRESINILDKSPEDVSKATSRDDKLNVTDDLSDEELAKQNMLSRVQILGVHIGFDTNTAVIKMLTDAKIMQRIKEKLNQNNEGYKVNLFNFENNTMYRTKYYVSSEKLREIQQMFLMLAQA